MDFKRKACWTLLLLTTAAAAGEGDEAWIDAWMERDAEAYEQSERGESLPFAGLPGMVGDPVRLFLDDGRVRSGVVESADAGTVTLRARAPSGWYAYTVPRDQVVRVERGGAQ